MAGRLHVPLDRAADSTLDDLIHDIQIVWAKPDAKRTIYDALLHTVNHASKLGEQVRRGEYAGVIRELGDTVMWFLTFVGKVQQPPDKRPKGTGEERLFYTPLTLTDIVWNKYPYTCHACFQRLFKSKSLDELWRRPCDCLLTPKLVEERSDTEKAEAVTKLRAFGEAHSTDKISKLQDWETMFNFIYEANYENLSLESIAFHLLEEVGEVADTLIRLYSYNLAHTPDWRKEYPERQANLEGEIADVVSWIFAVSLKLRRLYESYDRLPKEVGHSPLQAKVQPVAPEVTLVNMLWNRYGDRNTRLLYCPACRRPQCECKLSFKKRV